MTELENILSTLTSDEISDEVDTPIEAIEQKNKRDELKALINQGKAYLLPGKTPWTEKRLNKATDSVIEKLYADYQQREISEKAIKIGKAVSRHVTNLYSNSISKILKIDSVEQLRSDIDSDPIIKESMTDLGGFMVFTFGRMLAPLLVIAHTANHVDISKPELTEEE